MDTFFDGCEVVRIKAPVFPTIREGMNQVCVKALPRHNLTGTVACLNRWPLRQAQLAILKHYKLGLVYME